VCASNYELDRSHNLSSYSQLMEEEGKCVLSLLIFMSWIDQTTCCVVIN
jgi:hypothetical protein